MREGLENWTLVFLLRYTRFKIIVLLLKFILILIQMSTCISINIVCLYCIVVFQTPELFDKGVG